MSNEPSDSEAEAVENTGEEGEGIHVVFVDGVRATFSEDDVEAAELIRVPGDDPDTHDLVALRGESGQEVRVFEDDELVDLTEQHRKHFDTKAEGDTFI